MNLMAAPHDTALPRNPSAAPSSLLKEIPCLECTEESGNDDGSSDKDVERIISDFIESELVPKDRFLSISISVTGCVGNIDRLDCGVNNEGSSAQLNGESHNYAQVEHVYSVHLAHNILVTDS